MAAKAIVGYYKVWTTDLVGTAPHDAYRGPARRLPREGREGTDTKRIVQWIYPFSRESHDLVRETAFRKAAAVAQAIPRAVTAFAPLEQLDTYAIRVGVE